ncbi:MAG: ABC transporter permease [Ktedonobacteraceae bacterium]
MFFTFWNRAWVICQKDIRVWLRHPTFVLVTIIPALAILLLTSLGAAAVGHTPIALVVQDTRADGQEMARIFQNANIFQVSVVNAQQAQQMYKSVAIAAIITIPSDFTQRVQAHESAPLEVTVNNLNLDFTNDVRRSVPDMITQFYAEQGQASPIHISIQESNLRPQDIQLFQYSVLPALIFLLLTSGLITGGLTTAREWEARTMKELLLAPISRATIICGEILASFLTTFVIGVLVLGACTLLGWIHPQGIYWLTALLTLALVSLFSACLGIAVGSSVRRIQPVGPLSLNVGMYLFFLAGGIGVLSFEPSVLQEIANYIPLTYGRHALESAVFYGSSELLGRDTLVMLVSIAVALVIGVLAMRRSIA